VLTFDVTGVSQKNGAVFSHIRLLGSREPQNSRPRIPRGQLDLLVGCDIVAASAAEVTQLLEPGRSHAVINLDVVPTADFQRNPSLTLDTRRFQAVLSNILGDDEIDYVAAGPALAAIIGAGPLLNILLLGVASQRGLLPLRPESIEAAIGQGAPGKRNLLAFRLGRLAAQDRAALDQMSGGGPRTVPLTELPFDAVVGRAKQILTAYQSAGYAKTYEQFVLSVRERDRRGAFGKAVAANLFKLMRYKDEYEVARLYADPAFRQRLEQEFEGDYTLSFHLAPPILAFRTNDLGEPHKYRLGSWALGLFRVLRHFKFLRGTAFDPFGFFADRKLERRLIGDYRDWIEGLAVRLDDVNYDIAVAIASLPEDIRGYGPIKERNVAKVMQRKAELMAQLATNQPTMQAA
jgi:indolepyruvate ferredoxin oxidoreductase